VLTSVQMTKLFKSEPRFMAVRIHFTDHSFVRIIEHLTDLATLNARDRYCKFVEQNPDLVNRIPQYLLAAYLGMKPQSLSRLRGQRRLL